MQTRILCSLGRVLWRILEESKLDAAFIFRKHGLDPSLVQEARLRYPTKAVDDAWMEAAALIGSDHIGLEAAKHYTPLDLQALGVAFLSSSNLMEALLRFKRYEYVPSDTL